MVWGIVALAWVLSLMLVWFWGAGSGYRVGHKAGVDETIAEIRTIVHKDSGSPKMTVFDFTQARKRQI